MYLNSTTNLCQTCVIGEYFDATANTCRTCDGSCLKDCSYQKNCFICETGQYYDLDSKVCVDSCAANAISVNKQSYQGIPICKPLNIYVDPTSGSIIELGTKSDPYKNLVLAFLDLLNIFSHQNVTLNIFVKENTLLPVTIGSMYIINISKVNIVTYSDSETNPKQSTIVFSDSSVVLLSNRTLFNILSSANVTPTTAISNPALTAYEQRALKTDNIGLMINRCDLYISNFKIITNFTLSSTSFTFMRAIYLQSRMINITHVGFKIKGNIFDSYDPLDFNMVNIDIDYVDSTRGFYFQTICNDINSTLINNINFYNLTAYNSKDRVLNMIGSLISFAGAANFTLTNSSINVYGSLSNPYSPIQFVSTSSCNPNDGKLQTLTIQQTSFTLSQDSSNSKYVHVYSSIDSSYLRTVIIKYDSLIFNGIVMSSQPLLKFYVNHNTQVFASNISLSGYTFQDDIILISGAGYVSLNSISFINIRKFGDQLIHIFNANTTILSDLLIDGCTMTSDDKLYYILHQSSVGYLNISGLVFKNTDVKSRTAIYAVGVPSLTITNSLFQASTISSSNSLIRTGVISELNINGLNFTQIKSTVSGDNSNYLFDYDSFDLSGSTNFLVNNVVISNCDVSLFLINKVSGTPQLSKTFIISNLEYSNSTFLDNNSIMSFVGMELNIDFTIMLSDINFNSITFKTTGNLLLFQKQLVNQLKVSNLMASNLVNAYILIEAFNSHHNQFPTSILFSNMTTSNINVGFKSFITVMENSILTITNSNIQKVFSLDNGAVTRCSAENSKISFFNTILKYNSAIQGGVALVEDNCVVSFTNCFISNNFAVQSGVIQAQDNGAFSFYSSNITSNYAWSFSIGQCYDVFSTSIFDGSTISSNTNYDRTTILILITNPTYCENLCFINSIYSNYLLINSNLMSADPSQYALQLISSSLQISGKSTISNQMYIVDSFLSTIKIQNSTIKDTLLFGTGINASASNITISNMFLSNISTFSLTTAFIQAALESNLIMDSNVYINSSAPLLTLIRSECAITNLNSSNIEAFSHFVKFHQVTNATLSNWILNTVSVLSLFANSFTDSYVHSITNLNFNAVNWVAFYLVKTQIYQMDKLVISNCSTSVMLSITSQIAMITNSKFDSCGYLFGFFGALFLIDRTLGGALQVRCEAQNQCGTILQNITFQNNYASVKGGAIYYDLYRPVMTNVRFINNTSLSGPNISSYPVKVVLAGANSSFINLTNVASGQTQPANLIFNVVDYDNQLSSTISGGKIVISNSINNTSVLGFSSAGIVNGSATFTSLMFVANSGSVNVPFKISSNVIDSSKLLKQFGKTSIQDPMVISFRFCKPGEYIDNQQCKVCAPGTYSLDWNSTECILCPNNANCLGGVQIYVNSGYWRRSTNSTYMVECPRQSSCFGEYHPENKYPVVCEEGYSGILCTECAVVDGLKYERQSNFECQKCPILTYNILRIMGLILLVSLFFIILVIANIRKKKESQQSILLRILANYLQLLSVSMSFNMKFPPILVKIFYPLQKIGASSEAFLSLDCLFRDASIKGFAPSTALFKIFLTGMLPIFLIFISLVCWTILYSISKKWFQDFRRNFAVTVIVIVYLLHPTITKVSFEVFQCIRTDETEYRVKLDLNIECFSTEHIKWCFILGFPMIVFWVIGCPLAVSIILFKNRKNLNEPRIQRYLLLLYQGLKEKCFYWELVNTLRKILMVAINVFLSTMPMIFSATTAVLVLIALIRIQIRLKPYKNELNNELEIDSMVTGTATLFCGVLFVSDDNRFTGIVIAVLIVLILMNVKFLLHWCFCMSYLFIGKYKICYSVFVILGIILMKKSLAEKMISDAGIDNNDSFKRNIDSLLQKLPDESQASSEFSRFKSLLEETVVIENDKNSKSKRLKSSHDSIQSLEITQSNVREKEEEKSQLVPNIKNQHAVGQNYKFSTFAVQQQYDAHMNKKGEKTTDFMLIESSILEKDSEMESF